MVDKNGLPQGSVLARKSLKNLPRNRDDGPIRSLNPVRYPPK